MDFPITRAQITQNKRTTAVLLTIHQRKRDLKTVKVRFYCVTNFIANRLIYILHASPRLGAHVSVGISPFAPHVIYGMT